MQTYEKVQKKQDLLTYFFCLQFLKIKTNEVLSKI